MKSALGKYMLKKGKTDIYKQDGKKQEAEDTTPHYRSAALGKNKAAEIKADDGLARAKMEGAPTAMGQSISLESVGDENALLDSIRKGKKGRPYLDGV